ncbi:MAG: hypothetical protein AAF694_06150 [Bacteroidota bacterium]
MKAQLDPGAYSLLLNYKQSSQNTGKKAVSEDLEFLAEDLWLQDTVVFDWVVKLNGSWQIFLVFVYSKDPFLLIKRFVKSHISEKRARLEGHYMKRVAAKDQRGNLLVEQQKLNICPN